MTTPHVLSLKQKKYKKLITSILMTSAVFTFAHHAIADTKPRLCIDVYGTDKITVEDIRSKYGNDLNAMYDLFMSNSVAPQPAKLKKMTAIGRKIKEKIKADVDYSYFNASIVKHLRWNEVCFIVDVVEKQKANRLSYFIPNPTKSFVDPDNILSLWEGYSAIGYAKYFIESKEANYKSCPAFYCTFGFQEPEFKKYKNIFSTLANKNKEQLITILREDKDAGKRLDSVLLLAHIKNGNELINILLPAMRDSDSKVRRGAMEVLSGVLLQMKTNNFPVQAVIDALDYPNEEDRIGALNLLDEISKQPHYREYIKEHAKTKLLTLLKIEGKEIHNTAYEILKKISGLKFGQGDYSSWKNWINTNKA